jgi:hypothetical protein
VSDRDGLTIFEHGKSRPLEIGDKLSLVIQHRAIEQDFFHALMDNIRLIALGYPDRFLGLCTVREQSGR